MKLHKEQKNKKAVTDASFQLLDRIIKNVVENPSEDKFKSIKKDNKKIKESLTKYKAGVEVLVKIGFHFSESDGVFKMSSTATLSYIKGLRLDL